MADTMYVERANGCFEAWTYSDGERVYVLRQSSMAGVIRFAKMFGYDLVEVD